MKTFSSELQQALTADGVIAVREHPHLAGSIDWAVRRGRLVSVLPGVYAPDETSQQLATRLIAIPLWDPNAVLLGAAAAHLSFWPHVKVSVIACSSRHSRLVRAGYAFVRRVEPPELVTVRGRLRYTSPALTALDLCETVGGDGIDQVLRTRTATLGQLEEALRLTQGRAGNRKRRQLLLDSRAEPWSAPERLLHGQLRTAGIDGWSANKPVRFGDQVLHPDIVFRRERLVVEIDGREFHSEREAFESDRRRQNRMVLHGWTVLRFTWRMIVDDPDYVIGTIRSALPIAQSHA